MLDIEPFVCGYLDCAEWTTCENPDSGEFQPMAVWSDLALARAVSDCAMFLLFYPELADSEQAGHDLWLTRNRHGAGFWDRPEVYGDDEPYSDTAKAMGECWAIEPTAWEKAEYVAYSHWASYLINGDASGLEDEDIAEADAFIEWAGMGSPVDCEDAGFIHSPDFGSLAGDCQTYRFLKANPAGSREWSLS